MQARLPESGPYRRLLAPFFLFLAAALLPSPGLADAPVYRTITRTYDTSSYYTKGLLKKEVIQDSAGRPFTETENTYVVRDEVTGQPIADLQSTTVTGFPQLTRTDRRFYEGQLSPGKTTFTTHFGTWGRNRSLCA